MKQVLITLGLLSLVLSSAIQPGFAQDASARQQAEQVARDALIRGQAEKARNDEIVRQQQLQQEIQRQQQEEEIRKLEEFARRAKTG
ncbi:hypothetical protein RJJ37_29585 [Rhizobium redzepovicii]|uniref:Uncharacterized protein n=1 Tax=Rhizobium redzepovicii TaxID=2867518 RepID=A0AAW8P9J7_9HYPH|nr:hypothetical protein [Rhizobium redzepovicii]MDR9763734.1 hypothetical protein [Rhizobium redzepovicii]